MWMQHHSGIFRSTDAGAPWAQLKPPGDDFGFAVAAHPRDPETAWFVPAIKDEMRMPRDGALAVTRTRDGGKTWEALRDGLPQRDAYDLIYRHGLDVDETGTRLAMGSTTGALWVSETGGERWQLVNAHLPPIYAVRFAAVRGAPAQRAAGGWKRRPCAAAEGPPVTAHRPSESAPLPRRSVTCSLSQGTRFSAILSAVMAKIFPDHRAAVHVLPGRPRQWRVPTVLPSSSSVAIGSRNVHASLLSLPALHS